MGFLIPSYFDNVSKNFSEIFGFLPHENFYNLPKWYNLLNQVEANSKVKSIISSLKKEQNKDNPEELARLNFESGEYTTALEIMREIGKFEKGFSKFGGRLSWYELKTWAEASG